jgi:hypothetical protein
VFDRNQHLKDVAWSRECPNQIANKRPGRAFVSFGLPDLPDRSLQAKHGGNPSAISEAVEYRIETPA